MHYGEATTWSTGYDHVVDGAVDGSSGFAVGVEVKDALPMNT